MRASRKHSPDSFANPSSLLAIITLQAQSNVCLHIHRVHESSANPLLKPQQCRHKIKSTTFHRSQQQPSSCELNPTQRRHQVNFTMPCKTHVSKISERYKATHWMFEHACDNSDVHIASKYVRQFSKSYPDKPTSNLMK